MSFYYSVMYSFDLSRRLVGPFKDEESCWAAMVKDADHEHEEDLRNDTVSIVEKDKDAGEIVIKTPRELDDVPDTTTWSMFDNMEMPKNIVKAEAQMYFDSGACFHIPCKANLETREVYDLECSSGPCDDDGSMLRTGRAQRYCLHFAISHSLTRFPPSSLRISICLAALSIQ